MVLIILKKNKLLLLGVNPRPLRGNLCETPVIIPSLKGSVIIGSCKCLVIIPSLKGPVIIPSLKGPVIIGSIDGLSQ